MLRNLDLKGLSEIADGTVQAAFDQHLQRAISDCHNRPGDDKARIVMVAVLVKPVIQQDGAVVDVAVECEVSSKVPKHISRTVHCQLRRAQGGAMAVFNDMSQDDPRQGTIDQVIDRENGKPADDGIVRDELDD